LFGALRGPGPSLALGGGGGGEWEGGEGNWGGVVCLKNGHLPTLI